MKLNQPKTQPELNIVRVGEATPKKPLKITGILTSSVQLRGETKESYYYTFIRLKGQSTDLPVIFKLKDCQGNLIKPYLIKSTREIIEIKEGQNHFKPNLKKGSQLELTGYYANSPSSIRKSFTCLDYQILSHQKMRKKCFGCGDNFVCYLQENYDYCSACSINGSRYIPRESKCPECGNGSGIVQFPHQSPRACKICLLPHQEIKPKHA